jgi:hypothetical protein
LFPPNCCHVIKSRNTIICGPGFKPLCVQLFLFSGGFLLFCRHFGKFNPLFGGFFGDNITMLLGITSLSSAALILIVLWREILYTNANMFRCRFFL